MSFAPLFERSVRAEVAAEHRARRHAQAKQPQQVAARCEHQNARHIADEVTVTVNTETPSWTRRTRTRREGRAGCEASALAIEREEFAWFAFHGDIVSFERQMLAIGRNGRRGLNGELAVEPRVGL